MNRPDTQSPNSPTPPRAERRPHELTIHGHTRVDDYYWLRDKQNPDVIAYLEAENQYTEACLAHTAGLQETLYEEMVGRIKETDQSAPERIGDYFYYTRTVKGLEYPIYCRKAGSLDAEEQVLLDLNELAEGHDYLALGVFRVSPDHRLLAYSLDTSGAEEYVIRFKDLQSGELLPDQIHNTSYSAEWANDNETLYYTTMDEAKRDDKAWRHRLGQDPQQDELLYHEENELYRVYVSRTKDRRYLLLLVRSLETSEVRFLDAGAADGEFTLIEPRQAGVRYYVEHRDGRFYMITNADDAPNYKMVTAPVGDPARANWQPFIQHRSDVQIDDMDMFADHLVVYERENGLRTIRVQALAADEVYYVSFPEPVYTYSENRNPEFDTTLLRFTYQSLTTPDSVFDFNMETRQRELVKQQEVKKYNPDLYRTERIFATAEDGAEGSIEIPISLVYKKEFFDPQQPMPCLLYGYGSYGFSMDPYFNSNRISLLDRGMIFAIAHIRGGQEMGRRWYDEGKFLNKRNTFTDFITCARHLIDAGYTDRDRLAIMGRSAGGLLIGAVLNAAPELFHAAVAGVPFVDVVTTMLDESIPLTVGEFEEWGNPKDADYYRYMLSYSPYDNVDAREYPHLLVTAGLNDPRVQYWEPAKWVAKLRRVKKGNNRLLLKTEMGAGHRGPSGRYEHLRDLALDYAFILDTLGL
ncbi:MAG: S9 family peptidase, partial [Chloroflexota bacterium]